MNVLHKNALVLEHVTLGPQVEAVVPTREGKAIKRMIKIHLIQTDGSFIKKEPDLLNMFGYNISAVVYNKSVQQLETNAF